MVTPAGSPLAHFVLGSYLRDYDELSPLRGMCVLKFGERAYCLRERYGASDRDCQLALRGGVGDRFKGLARVLGVHRLEGWREHRSRQLSRSHVDVDDAAAGLE
jgi:hypothetical protein